MITADLFRMHSVRFAIGYYQTDAYVRRKTTCQKRDGLNGIFVTLSNSGVRAVKFRSKTQTIHK